MSRKRRPKRRSVFDRRDVLVETEDGDVLVERLSEAELADLKTRAHAVIRSQPIGETSHAAER